MSLSIGPLSELAIAESTRQSRRKRRPESRLIVAVPDSQTKPEPR
jgi:hypothetical protein